MIRLTAYIRPHRLEAVKSAIAALGVSGMSVTEVRGTGNSPEKTHWFGGEAELIALPIRSKIEVVASDDLQEPMIEAVLQNAQTGEAGDGKIFVERLTDSLRIRTGERGESAI